MGYLTGISPTLRELVTPTVDVYAAGVGFTAGSSTYIDLSADPGSENNVHISFDGVTQHHDTYSISGVRVTFDAAIPTGTLKIEARYAQENRNYTTIADDAVTLAKMASGTDGNVISYDASGNPVAIATGNDGQVLTSAGAGAPPVFEALPAGGWGFVAATSASGAATYAATGMATGYDYQIRWHQLSDDTDAQILKCRLGITGPTYRTSGYLGTNTMINSGASVTASEGTTEITLGDNTMTSDAGYGASGEMTIFDPAGSANTAVMATHIFNSTSAGTFYTSICNGFYATDEAHTAIQMYFASGNLTGEFVLYKRKIA